jgi:hypothetical protein
VERFFAVVDSCKGKVEMITDDGGRIDLKSRLSQYASISSIVSNGVIPEVELSVKDNEDVYRFLTFMING